MSTNQKYWFKCPDCSYLAGVDEDQAQGKVSVLCPMCNFHRTGIISPLVSVYTQVNPKTFTTEIKNVKQMSTAAPEEEP